MQMDVSAALTGGMIGIVFAFLFVDLFDTAGTLVGSAHRAKLLDSEGKLPRLGRALTADSTATVVGAGLGTSTTTSYIESVAGIDAGGRTGLTAVTVAVLFLLALFFAPLAQSIPGYATAPALLYVACLMAGSIADVEWEDVTEAAPAVVTAIAMPLTFSIAHGIAIGFTLYGIIKIASGKYSEASPAVLVLAGLFILKFIFLP
jgi:AGZA family xanthine/uracil permease-like MFS transporter